MTNGEGKAGGLVSLSASKAEKSRLGCDKRGKVYARRVTLHEQRQRCKNPSRKPVQGENSEPSFAFCSTALSAPAPEILPAELALARATLKSTLGPHVDKIALSRLKR